MAEKEATVYIVDVGQSMGEKRNGRTETDLQWSMRYVWDKIAASIATGRKTIFGGVVALHTDDTRNDLADAEEEGYDNITVLQPLQQTLMPDVRKLNDLLTPSQTQDGDTISAIVVAMNMIDKHCKKLKYKRQIIMVTNGIGVMEADDTLKQIGKKLKDDDIALTVLGVDFDDLDYGIKEESKDPTKEMNERILQSLVEDCNGMYGTMAEAIAQLDVPRVKMTRSVATFKGLLTLGDPENYDSAMCIDIERFTKVMIQKAQSASKYVVAENKAPGEAGSSTQANGNVDAMEIDDDMTAVKQARNYQVEDKDAPNGKRDVPQDELAKGYEYGKTAVAISESDMNVVNLETKACMAIVGFVDTQQYRQYFNMSRSSVIIGSKVNDKAKMALSSLIHALHELDCYAVARFVAKENKGPLLLLLAPWIEPDYECLMDVELPFAEDLRQFTFPPLDKVVTVAGKNLFQHRNLPNDDLMQSMGDYIDAMDLSQFDRDDEGAPTEYAKMEDTYSPVLHRINQVIKWRAVHPHDELPPPAEILVKYSEPPKGLTEAADSVLQKLIQAADVKKVPPRQKGRRKGRETEKPLSGLDVEALLGNRKQTAKISPENAIPELKQLLATSGDMAEIKEGVKQFSSIVKDYIRDSYGDSGYGQALEAIRVMREELSDLEEPEVFNDFIRGLKLALLENKLGGDRKEMWFRIRRAKMGLLSKAASDVSRVTEEEAKAFLSAK